MIRLRFLGTGGLGARPKNKLLRDYRRFSSLLIDDHIIIDPSEDIFEFEESFMLSGMTKAITDVFITHSHIDHFSVVAIERLSKEKRLRVYATEALKNELFTLENIEFIKIKPLSLIRIGKYSILPLPSNHITEIKDEITLNFLLEAEEKTIFYGLDGAMINPEAFRILKEVKLDTAILECALATSAYSSLSVNHNNFASVTVIKDIFLSSGVADENTKFILSHIPTSKKHSLHEELSAAAEGTPFKIAYDGYFLGV